MLGWEVDVVNTTQLSNHTGYKRFGGMRLDADHLQSVFEGMDRNGLLRYGRMLSGYTPSPSALAKVTGFVQRLRTLNKDLVYLLDPVMGDMGRGYYVDKECLPLYRELMASSTIICPNQFEAQELAGQHVTSVDTLKDLLTNLHDRGASSVIVTSVELPPADLEAIGAKRDGGMVLVGSTREQGDDSGRTSLRPWLIQFPQLEDYFVGVGDLFSALLLGHYQIDGDVSTGHDATAMQRPRAPSATANGRSVTKPLARAAELAVAGVQSVLNITQKYIDASPLPGDFETLEEAEQHVEKVRRRELRLVQARHALEHPKVVYRAQWLP